MKFVGLSTTYDKKHSTRETLESQFNFLPRSFFIILLTVNFNYIEMYPLFIIGFNHMTVLNVLERVI